MRLLTYGSSMFVNAPSERTHGPTPPAVDGVSIVDHNSQESVSTALLTKLCSRTWPEHSIGPDEHLPRSAIHVLIMSSAGPLLDSERPLHHMFVPSRKGWRLWRLILDNVFHNP